MFYPSRPIISSSWRRKRLIYKALAGSLGKLRPIPTLDTSRIFVTHVSAPYAHSLIEARIFLDLANWEGVLSDHKGLNLTGIINKVMADLSGTRANGSPSPGVSP